MESRCQMFTGYDAWCNERLHAAAPSVDLIIYRRETGDGLQRPATRICS
jgi:hypothetical protein